MVRRRWFIIAIIAILALSGVIANRLWSGMAWDLTFRAGMTYAPDLAHQYASYRSEKGAWPAHEELHTRLEYIDSATQKDRRIDRYACGPYAGYVLEVHLLNNGNKNEPGRS